MSTSVKSGPCGPCCSVAPVGTMTVWCVFRNASTSGFVISPRKTVGGFMARPVQSLTAKVYITAEPRTIVFLRPSSGACGFDDRFHVREVFFQRAAAGCGQSILGPRNAAFESLVADDVVGFFEFARVHA